MTITMNGHAPIGAEVLSRDELIALAECEQVIEKGLTGYIEVGMALGRVREHRLYRARHGTFLEYCVARWGITDSRARQLMLAAETVTAVTVEGLPAPTNEAQARELNRVPEDQRAEVWGEVIQTGGKPTAEKIRDAADTRKPDLAPTIVEALAAAGRDGLDLKAIAAAGPEPPADKDLMRALEKLTKSGTIVVTKTWGSGKPRKWMSVGALEDITPDVLAKLKNGGPGGVPAAQIVFLLDTANTGEPSPERVAATLAALAESGQARQVGETNAGPLWALAELVDAQTPGPAEAPSTAPAGSGPTSPEPEPGSEYRTDPAERIAAVAEVAPEYVAPAPVDEPRATVLRRAARTDLRRVIDLLVPADRAPGFVEDWIKQLGPRDDELAELIRRAKGAIAVLDDLIERAGQ